MVINKAKRNTIVTSSLIIVSCYFYHDVVIVGTEQSQLAVGKSDGACCVCFLTLDKLKMLQSFIIKWSMAEALQSVVDVFVILMGSFDHFVVKCAWSKEQRTISTIQKSEDMPSSTCPWLPPSFVFSHNDFFVSNYQSNFRGLKQSIFFLYSLPSTKYEIYFSNADQFCINNKKKQFFFSNIILGWHFRHIRRYAISCNATIVNCNSSCISVGLCNNIGTKFWLCETMFWRNTRTKSWFSSK